MGQLAALRARVVGVVLLGLLVCLPQESRAEERMPGSRNAEKELYQAAVEKGSRLGWRTATQGYYVFSFPEGELLREIRGSNTFAVSLSPDATQLAFFESRSPSIEALADPMSLVVAEVETGRRQGLGLFARDPSLLAWSPDGQKFALIATEATTDPAFNWPKETVYEQLTGQIPQKPDMLFIFSLANKTLEIYDPPNLISTWSRSDQIWSSNGAEISYAITRESKPPFHPEIWILTLATKKTRFLVHGSMPVWSPRGDWIAFRGKDGNCYRIRPDGSEQTLLLKPRPGWLYDLAGPSLWSPDGRWLLVRLDAGFDRFDSYVLDPETGVKVKVKTPAEGSWKGRQE